MTLNGGVNHGGGAVRVTDAAEEQREVNIDRENRQVNTVRNRDRNGDNPDQSGDSASSGIDWDAWREDVKQEASIKVGGKTVQDNEKGVQTKGPVDGTDPTSIYEADRDNLEASGIDDSGATNTSEDVDEFVESRNQTQSGGSDSPNMGSNSSGEEAGVGALEEWVGDTFSGAIGSVDTDEIVTGVLVALLVAWLIGGSSDG